MKNMHQRKFLFQKQSTIIRAVVFIIVCILLSSHVSAQTITVTGIVTDAETNEPLIGASVMIPGTTNGTATDVNGKYTITVPGSNVQLEYSYIGYVSSIETVGSRTTINVALKEDLLSLEEVVVVGYGTQKKESVIGAISTLGGNDLSSAPASNLTQAISGKAAGLIAIQSSGLPGEDTAELYVRGRASFASDGQPLVLVDGVERSFADIPVDDVAQISILKDASATAVYGVRGANGVILVTTKRGESGSAQVSLTTNFSLQTPTRLNTYLNSYEAVTLLEEALRNDGLPSQYSASDIAKFKQASEGKLTGDDFYRYPNVDWYNEALKKTAPTQQYNVNISGGTTRMKYFASLGYMDQGGLYKNFESYDYGQSSQVRYQRYSFRANLDFTFTKQFTAQINFGTRFEDRKGPNINDQQGGRGRSGVFYELNRTPTWIFPVKYPGDLWGGSAYAQNNIIALLSQGGFRSQSSNVNETSVVLRYDLDALVKGLSARAMGSFDYFTSYTRGFTSTFATYELVDRSGNLEDISNYRQYGTNAPLEYGGNTQSTNFRAYLEVGLNWQRTFKKIHDWTAMVLYNESSARTQAEVPTRYQGLVGRATYNYDRRYFSEVNFGYNGSENFAKGKRFGFFPSFSLGWMLSSEEFLKSTEWLDMLRLRATYGEVGNDRYQGNRFLYIPSWIQTSDPTYTFGNSTSVYGVYEGMFPNMDVSWERSRKYNLALESAVLNSSLSGSIDLFYENRSGILTNYMTIPNWVAVSTAPANLGKTTNKGIEVELKYRKRLGKVNFNTGISYAFAKNNIVSRDEPAGMPDYRKQEGQSIGQYYGLVSEGFFTSEAEIASAPRQTFGPVKIGDLKYRDMNSDGIIDERDVTFIGHTNMPTTSVSLNLGAEYKGVSVSTMLTGVTEVSRYYDAEMMFAFVDGGKARSRHLDRWQPSQSVEWNVANAKYPLLHYGAFGNNNQRLNSYFVQDGSYIRLRNVEVAYQIPRAICQKLGISNLRIFVNGTNLLTWDKLNGLTDPESRNSNSYPIMKVFNLGLNIRF